MLPINNSDTAWLIVSDYNQDNDKFYEDLREDVLNPQIDCFVWGDDFPTIVWTLGKHVGDGDMWVGDQCEFGDSVGGYIPFEYISQLVGEHDPN